MSINVCLEKGGYAIFLTLMGGGHAILSSRNRGGQPFFSYSDRGVVCHLPPPLKFMNSPLVLVILGYNTSYDLRRRADHVDQGNAE